MDHYEIFSNENEQLVGKLYDIYLAYYKAKKEFLVYRTDFMKVLEERYPTEYKKEIQKEDTKEIQKEDTKEIQKEDTKEIQKDMNIRTSSIFHKIALYSHPDKHNNVNPILFDQSVKASEKGKFGKLCFLAKFMNIPFDKLTNEEIQYIKETIQKKEKKIQHYERTYPVLYKKTNSDKVRDQLIEAFHKGQ
jgi:hypothetical protein